MKHDISSREDIDVLLTRFYSKLLADSRINYIFQDVVKVDMQSHLPIIGDFWESVLFNRNLYNNNPMMIHLEMSEKTQLLKEHFDTWVHYFNSTVDENFDGPIAFKAKERALSIATVMQIRIKQKNQGNPL